VITGTIKSQVDKVWDAFWSGGISNPLEVIEQLPRQTATLLRGPRTRRHGTLRRSPVACRPEGLDSAPDERLTALLVAILAGAVSGG
jgi:hypothetical protein